MKGVLGGTRQEFTGQIIKLVMLRNRRRKIRQAKVAARLQESKGGPSYAAGRFNESDPLLPFDSSEDSDDIPLKTLILKKKKKDK